MQRKQSAGENCRVHTCRRTKTYCNFMSVPRSPSYIAIRVNKDSTQIRAKTALRIFSLRLDWLFDINLELAEFACNSLIQSQMSLGLQTP
jgi:hypothetical protein